MDVREQALESYNKALSYFQNVINDIDSLDDTEQMAVGKSIFYSTASLMGEFKAEGPNGDARLLRSDEIRAKVKDWPEEQRKSLEDRVQEFRESDKATAMLAVATGAAEWALDRWNQLEEKQKAGQQVEGSCKTKAGAIHLCGTGYAVEAGKFADAINQMIREGKQEEAQSIIDATVNA